MIYIARKGCGFDRVFRKVWLGISEAKLTAFCTKIGVDKDWVLRYIRKGQKRGWEVPGSFHKRKKHECVKGIHRVKWVFARA
jgi:hypothetical protein